MGNQVTISFQDNSTQIESKLLPDVPNSISDGYHEFNELYNHRHALYLAFLYYHRDHSDAWRSCLHSDGSSYDGYFIVGCSMGRKQISYHLPNELWDKCNWLEELERSPEWDGHTSDDVLALLMKFLTLIGQRKSWGAPEDCS